MQRLSAERVIGVGLALSAIALVAVLALGFGSDLLTGVPTSTPSAGPVTQASATAAQAASPAPTATPSDSPTALTTPAPTPTPTAASSASLQLPAMLATIGDSYTQAWSVSPAYKKDHPGYSWAVGNVKGDHVFSLRERFEALGDNVAVVDAATSGKKMSDAARQATEIVAAAGSLAQPWRIRRPAGMRRKRTRIAWRVAWRFRTEKCEFRRTPANAKTARRDGAKSLVNQRKHA